MRAAPSLLLALSAISLHVDVQASLTTASLISAKYGGSFSTALPKNDIGELIDSEITTCTSWGWSHYRTFDDRMYTYNGQCKYLLAQSPGKFNILVDNNRICPLTPCHRSIEIYFGDTSIKMTSSFTQPAATDVTWNGEPFKIPGSKSGSRFEKIGSYIIFRNPLGFSVKWDGEEYIVVELSTALKYEVTGLCGKYNGDPTDDFEAQNGQNLTSVVKFVSSWKQVPLMDTGPVCTDGPPTLGCKKDTKKNLSIEKASSKKCQALLFSQEFKVCHKFVPVERFYEACKMDCCDARGSECMCSTMEAYSRACARHRVIMDWRKTGRCEVHCGGGKVFRENGTTCEPDCLHTQAVCYDDDFVEGCFCPEGKVIYKGQCIEQRQCPCLHNGKEYNEGDVIKEDCNQCVCQHSAWNCTTNQCYGRCSVYGDGHIHTFDHSIFTFMGKCSYYMVRSPGLDIIISSKGCDLGFECSKSLKIMYMHKKIELYSDKRVFFNDSEILSLPFSNHEFRITEVSSLFLKLKLSNDFEVMWNGGSRIHIGAPPESKGTTKGLCGTFDGKQSNDFLTPQNIWESDPTIFGNKWITHKYCANAQVKNDPNPCDKQLQRKNEAHQHCSLLKSSVFAACHNVYEVEEYYKNCMIDMCTCEKNLHDCLCPTLGFYADACTAKGVYIDWRLKVDECKLSCPAGQAYQVCGRPCERTCLNYAQDQDCQKLCVEGCNCPDGNALNRNGECVPVTDCPCMFDGKEYRPGFTTIKGTELCVCGAAKWECQQITSNFTAQVSNLESLCGKNKEYKRCPDPCPDTCGNLDDTDSKCESSTACNEGCVCKPGFVLNGDECIQKESCPCTHGGKEYSDGEYFLMDCNKCTCKSHEWNCEQNECPGTCTAYGDSHYTTFDGLKYDFHGSCDYILAQSVGAQDRFEITIHNVPCGTSGVTCSKGINIIVGRERTTYYYNLHLVKGKKIRPPYGSPYVISDIGQMKYIQLPGGVSVEWDQGTRLYIRVPISFMNMTEGLCGNFNGDRNDDFTIRKNEPPASKATVFGDNWRLHSYCEPSMDIEESCELVPHRKPWATKECSLLSSELFEPCHGTVPHEGYLERCVFDACACDEGGGCECMCTAIAAYAHECASNGISIHWRTNEFCGLECSSCKEYNPCMSRCPKKTCENRLIFDSLTKDCEDERGVCFEGCDLHPCPDGQVYDSLIEPVTCIPETLCQSPSCKVGNKNYKEGERINDPTVCNQKCEICICRNGKIDHMTYGSRCEPIVVTVPTTIIPPTHVTKTTSFTPPPPVGCVEDGWTSWMSAVVPTYDNVGDKETEPGLRRKYSFCSKEFITNIKCEVIGQMPGFFFGQNVTCDVNSGLTCRHSDQDGGMCLDYEISFFCDCHKNVTGFPTTVQTTLATESTTTPFIATTTPVIPRYPTPSCGWTPWMNSFTPDIGGDEESISNLRLAFSFCQHPIKILCRTVPDQTHPNGLRYDYAGQRAVTCNLNSGLICLNNVQQFGENCFDYEVMVQCIDACASTTEFSSKPTPSVGITVNTSSSFTGTTSSSTGSTLSSTGPGGIGSTSIGTTMSSIGTTETTLSSTGPGGIGSSSTGTTRTSPASPPAGTASTTASPPTPVISSTTYTGTPVTTATPGVTVSTSTGSTTSSVGSSRTTPSGGNTGTTTSGGNTGTTQSGGNTGTTTSGGNTGTATSGGNTGTTTSGGNTGTTTSGENTGPTSSGNTGTTPSGGNTGTTPSGGNTGSTPSGGNTGSTPGGNTGTTSDRNTRTTPSGGITVSTSGGNTGTTPSGGNTGTTPSGGNTGTTKSGGNTGTSTSGGNTGTTQSGENTGTTSGRNTGTTTSGGNTGTTPSGGDTGSTSGQNTGTTPGGNTGTTSDRNTGTTPSGGNTGTTPSGGNTGTTTSGGNTGTTPSGRNTGTTPSGGDTGSTSGRNTGTTPPGGNTGTTTSDGNTGSTPSGGNTGTTPPGGNTGTTTSGGNTGSTPSGRNTGTTPSGGDTGSTSGRNTGTTPPGGNTGTTTSDGNTGSTPSGGTTGTTPPGGNTGTTTSGGNTGSTPSGGNTGTTPPGGNTGTTTSGGNTGSTMSGGNTGTTPSDGNTGSTPSGGNTGTTTSGRNTGTTQSGGNTGTTSSGGDTGSTPSGRNTGTTPSGGDTGSTSGRNTGTTPPGGNTGTTTSGGNTGSTPSDGNTGTTPPGGNTGSTPSGGNTGTTPPGGNTGTTTSGGNTGSTPSGGNTGTTPSGGNTGTTPSGGNTGTTKSGRNTGTTQSGGNTGTTSSGGDTGSTPSGRNTGTTPSGGDTGSTSGRNTGTTPPGGNTGTTTSGGNTGSTPSDGNTGTTPPGGNTGSTPSGGNTGTTPPGGNTGTTTSGGNTGSTPSGGNTGTTPPGGNTGTTTSGGNTGSTPSGGNTGTTPPGGNTGTTTSGGNTGSTTSGGNTGTTPSGGNTGTTPSGGNTGTTPSGGNTGTTPSGGNTGTTTSGRNTGTTQSDGNTGTTSSGGDTGSTPSGRNTGTTPSGGDTGSTSGRNTGTTPPDGNTGTTTSGGNTGSTPSDGNTGTTPPGGNTGSTPSGGNTGTTPPGGNTGTTTSGGNTGSTPSGGNTGTTPPGGNTGTTTSGGNTGSTPSGGNTGTTPPGGNTGTTTSGGNTGTTPPGGNTGGTTSGRNTGSTPSGGNTGSTSSGNTGTTPSGGNTGTTPSGGNTGSTPSGGSTGATPGGNTGTTPSGGNTETTLSGGNTGSTPSGGNTGSTPSSGNTGSTASGGNTETTPSSGNTGTTSSGRNTGTTSGGNTGTTSGGNTGTTTPGGNTGTTVASTGPGGIGSSSTGTIKTSPSSPSTGTVRTTASPPTPATSTTTYTGTPGTTGGIASTISVETPGVTVSTSTVTTGITSSSAGPGGIGSSSTGTTGTTAFSSSYTTISSSKPSSTTSFGTASLTPGSSHFSTIYTETTLGFTTTPNPPVTSHGKACDDLLGLYNPVLMGADHFLGTSSSDVAYDPSNARLNNHPDGPTNGGSWMPRLSDKNPELEIDLKHKVTISGVITQGQPSANQWVTKYEVFISKDGNTFEPYSESSDGSAKVFTANFDSDTPVKVFFNKSISVRKLKIHPTGSFNGIALRMDLLTCEGVTLPTTFQTPTPRHGGGDTTVTPTPALFAKMDLGFDCDSDLNVNLPSNVPDKYMTSYSYSNNYSHPSHGRLGNNDSAWIPNTNANGEWFEVDLQTPHFVTTVLTQGHPKKSRWVSSYYLAYSTDGHLYRFVKNEQKKPLLFSGNYDENKVVANKIPGMMLVRKLRIYPLTWPTNGIALRVDFKGCKPPGQTGSTLPSTTEEGTQKTTISSTGTTGTTVSSTGTTSSGGGTGPTLSGGSTGTTPSDGNTGTTQTGGNTGTTPSGGNTGTTTSGGNTGTTQSGGNTGTTSSSGKTETTQSGGNTGTTSGGNTGTTQSGGNTVTTPSGGNTGTTQSGGNTVTTPSGGNTGTTSSGNTGTTSGGNTGTTQSGGNTGTTPSGGNTGTTSGGNTGTTPSDRNTGSTTGGNTGTTPSGRNTGPTSGGNTGTTSGKTTEPTPSGGNTGTTTSGGNTESTSGGNTGTTPSGGNTETTPSGGNTGTTTSGGNTGTTSGGNTGTTPSDRNTGSTSGGNTGTTPSGGNTGPTSGGNTGTTSGKTTGPTPSGGNTGTTTSGGNTESTSGENTGTTPSGGNTGPTSSGGSTGTTPSGENTGTTPSGGNTGTTNSVGNTKTTQSGGSTGTTPSGGNTGTTTSDRNTGTTTSGGNTGPSTSGGNTRTTPSGGNTETTSGGNTGSTPSGGNTGTTTSSGNTGTTPSGENTGTTSDEKTGPTPSGGNTGTTTSSGNTGSTSGENTGTTPSGGNTGPTSSSGSTGTTQSGESTGTTPSGGNTGTTTSGRNTGTTTSGGNTRTTPSGGNTETTSGGNTGTTPSGGNTGTTTSGRNIGTTSSGENTGTTISGGSTDTTPSGGNSGTTPSEGNTETTPSSTGTIGTRPPCIDSYWLPPVSRSQPEIGTGDIEFMTKQELWELCSGTITKINCYTEEGVSYSKTGDIVECTPSHGLVCSNSRNNHTCQDYIIRYFCDCSFIDETQSTTVSTSSTGKSTQPPAGTPKTTMSSTGTTPPGGDTGTTPPGGNTGTTPPGGNTGTTPSGGNTGTTTSGGNTGTTPPGGNTGTTSHGGNTGTTSHGGNTGTTTSGGNTGTTTSGGNTGTTPPGGNTGTTPPGGNTGTTTAGRNTGTTSGGNTRTTPSGGSTGITPSGGNTGSTSGEKTGTTTPGGSTGTTPPGGNTGPTSGGNTGTTPSGGITETTPSNGSTGSTSGENTGTTTSGRNTGTTPSGESTGSTSGEKTGTTTSGRNTGTTTSGRNTGTTTSGRNTGTTSGGNTRTTPSGGNTGTTPSGGNTGSTSGKKTGTTTSGGNTGTTPSGGSTGTTPPGGNTGPTSGGNTGTTPSGGSTGTTPSGGNTGTTPSGGSTGTTPSGGNTGTTPSGGSTGPTSGGNTGTTPSSGSTGTTTSGGNTGTTPSGENTGTTPSGGNTGTTPGGNTGTTQSGGNTGSTPGGNTDTTQSGGNTGSTPSVENTGTTPSGENTGTTQSGGNTGTTSGGNTETTPSGGHTGTTSGGNTGTTPSGGNTGKTPSSGNTETTPSGGNTGTTPSGGNTGTTPSGENTGTTQSGGNTETTPSGGNTGTTSGGNTGTTPSGGNTGTTPSSGNTETTPSGGNTGTTPSGGNTGTTPGGNTGTTQSGGNTGSTPSVGNTGTTPSGGNTGTTSSGRSTGTTPSGGNAGTTSSGRSTGTTPSSGEGTSSSTRSSTSSSATIPSTETSSMSTLAPVCISRWSEWIDRNTDTRLIGDRERLDPHVLFEFCPGGRITNILCYDTVTNQDYRTFSDQSECSIAKGFVCRNKADPPGQPPCRNYKIRYQCDCGDTTPPTYTTVAPTTHKIQVRCGWSPWLNADSPKTGSGDMETISALKKTFGVCQAITDIDCRVAGTATSSGTAGQNGITCDVYNGLRCYNSDAKEGHCFDYEVRLLCWDESCEGKSTPRRAHTTPEPTTSTTVICPPGKEWQSCAYRCSDVCNYRGMKAGACENPAIDDCIPGCKPINSKVTCKYHERLNQGGECVDRQMCPCLKPDGTPALPYDTWVNPDAPCSKCSCIMNEIVCGHDQGSCGTTPEPTPPPTPGVCGLTPWMNGDGPKTGDGDLELIPSLRKKYGFCSSPSVIQCRDAVSKKDVKDIGQDVTCGLSEGLKCFNYNNDGGCLDYEIRLLCPCNNLSSTPTVITPPQTTRKTYDCGWTNWMSNHVNNTAGDTEDIPHLRKKYKFCDTDAIVNIQCREKATALTLTDDESDVICDMYSGLICFNSIRESGTCPDYEVRYMCDAIGSDCSKLEPTGPAPTPSGVYPTPTPGGNPEPICDTELGLRNGDIPEYRITTSSFRDTMHSPKYLRFEGRSSWMPYYSNRKQYVQIDFGVNNVIVTGIKTEGNTAAGTFVKTFKVLHSEDGTTWTTVKDHKHRDQVFKNKDGLPATTYFDLPVRARYIRVNPLSWRGMISLRMELVGCPYTVPTPGVPEVTATTPTVITTFVSTGKPHIKTTSPPQYPDNCVNWYPWINKHRPTFNDTNDKEPVDDFLDDTPGCSHVVAIECRTATPDHTPYNSTGQDVDCNTWNGLKCTSDKSGHQMCYDYEARIGCLKNTPKCLHPPSEIPPCYAGMDTSHCPKAGCAAGLYCNGTQCVQKSECPCILDKTVIVANGLIRSKDCETCQCLNGEVICVPKVCPNSDCPQGYVGLNTTNCECQCDACSPFEYQCANAVCIPSAMRCDGIVDCIDDEVGCGITTLTGSSTTPTRSSPTVTVIVHNTTLSSGPTASVPSSLSTETTEVNSGSTTEGQRSGSTTPSQKSTTGIMWSTTGGFVKTTMGKSTKPTSHITFGPTGSTLTTGGGEFSSTSHSTFGPTGSTLTTGGGEFSSTSHSTFGPTGSTLTTGGGEFSSTSHSTFGPTGSTLTTGGGEFSSTSHSTFGPTGSTLTTGGGEFSSTSHSTFGPTGSTLTTGGGEFSSTSHSTFGPTGSTLTTGGGEFSSTSHSTFGPTGSTLTTGGGEFSSTSHSTFGPTGSTLTTGGGEFSSTSHSTFGPTGSTLTGGKRSSPSSDTTASPTASVSTPKYSTQAHCAQVTCAPLGKFHMEEGITVTLEKTEDGCCQRYSVCNTSECKNQQTNCSAPYISVAESRKHCCPQYHCECPTSCPRVTFPTCKQGFQPHRIAQDCNCFTFVCTPVPSLPPADCSFTVADNADTKTYKVNETWTVGACKTCKCNLEGEGQKRFPEVSCTEKECKTCKKGEKLVNKTGDCCGECVQVGCMVNGVEYQAGEIIPTTTKCRNTTCEKDPVGDDYIVKDSQVKCPDEETLPTCKEEEDSMGPDGCCKKCIPPPPVPSKCYFIVVDPKATKHRVVKSYKVNETWTVGACKTCKCSSGEGEAKYPEVSCIEKECKTCKKGEKLVNKTGDCCGECVQVGCMVYGVEYQAGEIIPTTTKCRNTTCEKDLFGDGYIVRDSPVTCPDQETLPTCKDKEDSKDPDGCCNKCVPPAGNKTSHCNTCSPQLVFGNNKKSVGYFKVKLPSGAVCTNKKPLNDLKECTGYCASQSKYTSMMQGFENSCKCCQAAKTTSHAVKLTCSDGSTVTKSFRMPTTCSCRACSGGAKTPTPNKISQAPMTVSQG